MKSFQAATCRYTSWKAILAQNVKQFFELLLINFPMLDDIKIPQQLPRLYKFFIQ